MCHVISENSSRQALYDSHTFDRLLDFITDLNLKCEHMNFILCGDFNSHMSDLPDFVPNDTFSHNDFLPEDYCTDSCLKRCSMDKGRLDNNGTLLLDLCKQTGLRILNGRVGNDKNIGRHTFVGNRGSSVVDYVITTQNLITYVNNFNVHEPNIFFNVHEPNILSDHCFIDFSLKLQAKNVKSVNTEEQHNEIKYRNIWNEDKS